MRCDSIQVSLLSCTRLKNCYRICVALCMSSLLTLSAEEVEQFINFGYVAIRHAFSEDVAKMCRATISAEMLQESIDERDLTTWPEKFSSKTVHYRCDGYPWSEIFSGRLLNAIGDLLGRDSWNEFSSGWSMVTFPTTKSIEAEYEYPHICGNWHIDGHWFQHYAFSKELAVLPVFYFNDVKAGAGGTAVAIGSHFAVGSIIIEAGCRGVSTSRIGECIRPLVQSKTFEIKELTGAAGDVFLLHPWCLHARTTNNGNEGASSIRFMTHPTVSLKNHIDFSFLRQQHFELADQSPLVQSIVRCAASMSLLHVLQGITPISCASFEASRNRKRVRYDQDAIASDNEDESDDEDSDAMYKSLGFSKFG